MILKPCPFCGKKPRLWYRSKGICKYTIGCDNPECFLWIPKDVLKSHLHNYAPCFREKKEAIEVWNTRPNENKM